MSMLIIADDLSGAADCAIGFASAGYRTGRRARGVGASARRPCGRRDRRRYRHAPADGRRGRAAHCGGVASVARTGPASVQEDRPRRCAATGPRKSPRLRNRSRVWAIVAPAFPATGRTLRGGRVLRARQAARRHRYPGSLKTPAAPLICMLMLAEVGLSTAQLNVDALREGGQALTARIAAVAASGTQALIVDAETSEDLLTLAQATTQMDQALFWVGSGGLAREIASLEGLFDARAAEETTSASERQREEQAEAAETARPFAGAGAGRQPVGGIGAAVRDAARSRRHGGTDGAARRAA